MTIITCSHQLEQGNQPIRVVSIVIYSIVCILGIPGNAFVIWIAGVKMKRTVNTVWFVNLAVADLLCCFSIPFRIAVIKLELNWPFGEAMCKVMPSVMYLNMFASVFTLVLISLDRFVLVIPPVWAQNHRKITLAWLQCGLAWFLGMLLSLPDMIHNQTINIDDNLIRCCSSSFSFSSHMQAKIFSRLVLGFLVPLLVIAVCYLLIGRRVSRGRFKSQRVLQVILSVVAAFVVCWLPYHIIVLLILYRLESFEVVALYPLGRSLAYVNSCLNPILYVFIGQDFKEIVKVSLRKVFENVFSEDV
ncbi:C3a anaphylatoxin chemotactic receptor-like [Coregonus clupeaformis]|uniref:C3a anaphylatoxin chemotactic receptor-like n=1 Tax=Coregonus clupeaformis TaxID=59861 RepID=UPI001BE00BE9|nr:C3a anaphylatoxin chemotactic receptor-like [Coregonus clupeaformis]